MNDNSRKNDTLSSIDEEAFLAGVDALAEECGDWRWHITASAAADPCWPDIVGPEITEYGVTDQAPYTPWQVCFLRDLFSNMRNHRSPTIRTKFLTAWDFYAKRYPSMVQALVNSDFDLSSLGPAKAWQ